MLPNDAQYNFFNTDPLIGLTCSITQVYFFPQQLDEFQKCLARFLIKLHLKFCFIYLQSKQLIFRVFRVSNITIVSCSPAEHTSSSVNKLSNVREGYLAQQQSQIERYKH